MNQGEFARVLSGLISHREPFVLATVVRIEGSSLGKPGFKALISKDGETLYGSLGGACPESAIANAMRTAISTGTPKVITVYLESVEKAVEATIRSQTDDEVHVETNCGGVMEVYVEPYLPQQRLFIVGQGGKDDVENELVKLGKTLDFEVIVVDHAPLLTEEPDELISRSDYDLSELGVGEADSVIVLTKGERDQEVLVALSKFRPRYVGLVASRMRAQEDIEGLRKRGVSEEFIGSIRAPAGADLGGITSAEIALSIIADVVATRHGRKLPQKGGLERKPLGA
ncbi:MAG: XdhC family protein [Thaumarchaeota archaeon]|nr:XdhC family protein [Nitrososphaerota archaeon]